MDEIERRIRALELRQDMMEILEALRIARSFNTEAELRLWGDQTVEAAREIAERKDRDPQDISGPLYLDAWSGLFAKALRQFQQDHGQNPSR